MQGFVKTKYFIMFTCNSNKQCKQSARLHVYSINTPELRYLLNLTNFKSEMRSISVPPTSLIWYLQNFCARTTE